MFLINTNELSNNNQYNNNDNNIIYSNIFDLDNIYGIKINVLIELNNRINNNNNNKIQNINIIHFVEDRYETLVNVINIL